MPDWSTVLDDLEHRLDADADAAPWSPPAGIGAPPAELRARAEALLARQRTAIAERTAALARIGTELSGARRAPLRYTSEPAVYIDTVG